MSVPRKSPAPREAANPQEAANPREASALREAVALLEAMIRIPSFSREEGGTADLLADWLSARGAAPQRSGNNLWVRGTAQDPGRPTVMLCSHHDTVRPVASWQRDPFDPLIADGRLTGLGSNDAGGCLVALCQTFLALRDRDDLPFNLLLLLSAEEEIAGAGGVASVIDGIGPVDLAIVGEPTDMELAVAEKGLMVLDGVARGRAGHAARDTGVNAISIAARDIARIEALRFPEVSPLLGPVRLTVTQIEAGTQHNVIPDICRFVVDVRVTECHSHEEILETLRAQVESELTPRSMRLRPSAIETRHPVVRAAEALGLRRFGSPTMSDQALLRMPSVKIGPGRSERSHTADEYITLEELERGLRLYPALLERYAEELR